MFDVMPKMMLNVIQFYINKNDDKGNTFGYCGDDTQFNAGIKATNTWPV
jgi:hypothetical protein